MQSFASREQLASPTSQEIEDFWAFVNLNDHPEPKDLWGQFDVGHITHGGPTVSSAPSSPAEADPDNCTIVQTMKFAEQEQEREPEQRGGADENDPTMRKKAKRQAQNRVAQQAFRARKEKLVRSLSVELANLQCQYSTTKAENERLTADLRLAQTELFAIRSVLRRTPDCLATGQLTPPITPECAVSSDASPCTLTLKINLDTLMSGATVEGMISQLPDMTTPRSKDMEGIPGQQGQPLRYE